MNPFTVFGSAVLMCAGASTVHAADPPPPPAEVQFVDNAPSDLTNYLGDLIEYPVVTVGKHFLLGSDQAPKRACIPKKAKLKAIGKGKLGTEDTERIVFKVRSVPTNNSDSACTSEEWVQEGDTVALDSKLLQSVPPDRYGWTFGTLFVPYKYQLRGDRSMSGGSTLGGYLGWRTARPGVSLQFVVFAGATKVDVPETKDGKTEVKSLAGFSSGVGILGSVKDGFKMGFVVGTDRVNRSAGYTNNGKTWVSLSLGYDFFN
jgi:hypothetical protein